ncbi:MAG: hypothetical protein MUP04_11430, partial [Anaerolineae bacterium]|nr:hypothetical protein [Anaerolineae bacterium]
MTLAERRRFNEALISGVLGEDVQALSDLYDECLKVVRRYAHHIPSLSSQDPEDFAGEVFVALVEDECAA